MLEHAKKKRRGASLFFCLELAAGVLSVCFLRMSVQANEKTPLLDVQNVHNHVGDGFKAAVFGFSDGLTTSISLVLGVALLHQDARAVVMTGMAGLFAGAASMACGEWLSNQAEQDSYMLELERERDHLRTIPQEEARHMKEILMAHGLAPATADAVNHDVAQMDLARQVAFHGKFELGIELDNDTYGWHGAVAMWLSFVVGAFIPICPWLLTSHFSTAVAGTAGGSALGMAAIAAYQVRGRWAALPRAYARQACVVAAAAGLTVLFNYLFLRAYRAHAPPQSA